MTGVGLKITVPTYAIDNREYLAHLRRVMRQAGTEVAKEAQKLVRKGAGSGRQYGDHIASAPGEPPASLSGNLASSFKVRSSRNGLGVTITDYAFYALALEAGARGGGGSKRTGRNKRGQPTTARVLQPRPFLSLALENVGASLQDRVARAVDAGVKLKEVR